MGNVEESIDRLLIARKQKKANQPPRKPYVCHGFDCTMAASFGYARRRTYCPYPQGHPQADETAVCEPVPEL